MTTAQERVDLLNKIGLAAQNKATLGQVLGTGSIGQATEGSDGRMQATIRINPDELTGIFILVMPHGGDIDLELVNDDLNTHCALLPSNGDRKFIWLVNHSRGRGDPQPRRALGHYWFGSPTGNDEGRGLTGAIVVMGDAPPEARLDRPEQPRP
ncbi:copper oxidase [Streptomyces hirsutus]